MKKFIIIIISTLLLTGCSSIKNNTETEGSVDAIPVTARKDFSQSQNDLVYHDYGTGIKLSPASTLLIPQLDLDLQDESAVIYVINLDSNEVTKLCDYQPLQDVSYSPASDGVYKIAACISNGKITDLTPKAVIQTDCTEEDSTGFILLTQTSQVIILKID